LVRWYNDNLDLSWKNQVVLLLDLTLWSLTSCVMKVEFSHDNIDFYQETSFEVLGWIWNVNLYEYNINDSWKYRISFPIKDKFMKISIKGAWTTVWSLLKITSITWLS